MCHNVLIISHLKSSIESLRSWIEKGGYKVLISFHLEEILKLGEEGRVDLIIIDADDSSLDSYGICQS